MLYISMQTETYIYIYTHIHTELPQWLSSKESTYNTRDTGDTGVLQSIGSLRVGYNWSEGTEDTCIYSLREYLKLSIFVFIFYGEGYGNPF